MLPSNAPHLWTTYEAAKAQSKSGHVGFAFHNTDGLWGCDLDDCIVNGVLTDMAAQIVEAADSYTEVSVSGTGLKIWLIGKPPFGLPCRMKIQGQIVEQYNHGRWFMVTGKQFGSQSNVRSGAAVSKLLKQVYIPPPRPQLPEFKPQEASASDLAKYTANFPPAISGQNGHSTLMSLCRRLAMKGCSANDIIFLVDTHYNRKCQPPWSQREIQHKALDAVKRK